MHSSVLVLTSTPGFGELIQQTLEDSGRYQVTLTDGVQEALRLAGSTPFDLSILDMGEEGVPGSQAASHGGDKEPGLLAGRASEGGPESNRPELSLREVFLFLRKQNPAMRLVIVPPNNDPEDPIVMELRPDGYLTKPFYLPDLLDTLDEVMQTGNQTEESKATSAPGPAQPDSGNLETPAWLTDVNRAAQYLARLSMESAAQAALIVCAGELWAYAGELPQPAAMELSQVVTHHWSRGGSSDLARFFRLEATRSEYMLYATRLGGEMVLALVFDIETPFSKIRSQASHLARALASPPGNETNGSKPAPEENPAPGSPASTGQPPVELPPLFDNVPPPLASGWTGSMKSAFVPLQTGEDVEQADPSRDNLDESGTNNQVERPVWEPEMGWEKAQSFPPERDALPDPLADSLAETRPMPVSQISAESLSDGPEVLPEETSSLSNLLPVSAAVCNLNYACMLIPRLPNHHLAGELGASLSEWVAQLCLAFGWRLGHLAVRPDYLLWIVNVSPTVSPSYLVRLIRQHTSQRIFSRFQELAQENPSGDFWAPGYLVMSSSQPPPVAVMQDFIQGTRRRQGAVKSHFRLR